MEPVEIDIQMKQNVTEESKKATAGINDISEATDKTNAAMGSIVNTGKQAVTAAKAAVQEQVNVVKQIEADIKNIEKQIVTAAPGNAKSAMIEELQAAKQALSEEKAALGEYSTKVDEAAQSNVRLRTQVMNAKQTLDEMAQAGLRGTEAYKEQQTVLGELQARMNSANKQAHVLGDPQGGMHAAMQTATGMSGAFTAATGVMSLFAGENADLQKIQMRLQAVMAITIGLTQTAEMLNKNSYFTLKILIPAKEMLAAAELKVATALGISTVAARALMATLTLGLSVAIGAAIYLYDKWSSAQEKQKKKAEELAKEQADLAQKTADDYGKELSKVEALRASLDGENVSRKQKLSIINELKKIIPSYTAELDKEGNVVRENKKAIDEYMISLDKSLKLRATEGYLANLYSKIYKIESSPDFQREKDINEGASTVVNKLRANKGQSPTSIKTTTPELDKLYEEVDNAKKYISQNNLVELIKPDKVKREKSAKEEYNAAEELQKLLLDINSKTSDLLIKQQEDGLQKRLDEIDHEKEEEVRKITEKETAIVEAYNKNHRTEKGFKPLSTKPEDLQSSLTTIDPKDTKSINDALLSLDKSYQSKSIEATEQWGQKMLDLAGELADKRVKIEDDWNKKINQIDAQAQFLDTKASTEIDPALKKKYEDEAAYLRTGEEDDKVERDKRVSEVTMSYIKETEGYKLATDQQLNLGKKLNDELINKIKERVKAELASNQLTQEDANKILTAVEKSQAKKVSGSIVDLIDSYSKLKKAKEELATAQKNGDQQGIIKSTEAVENYTKANESSFQQMQKGFSEASFYANQAITLLNAISTKDGDAASSAAKSIGAVMNIADATMQGYAQGGPIGAAVGLITSTLTQVFEAEKAHQAALAAIAKAKLDTQKEYNDLLMKQNELLKASESIFGTDAYGKANAYAAQMASYNTAKNNSVSNLSTSTVQTGSHKTGLFGWGGEKADYSSLLSQYPKLIDAQGNLNTELAQSILDNQKLDDSSKAALQSALDYTKDYEDALANLQSYLNSVFGSLGDDLMTTIVDNLNDSKAALDDFGDYVGKAVQKMLKDLAYSIFFAKMFNDLSDNLTKIYSSASLTDADKEAQASDAIGTFYGGLDTKIAAAAKFYNDTAAAFEKKTGIDMSSDTTRTGTSKGIATASQDSIDELTGGVYAMRIGVADIRNFSKLQADSIKELLIIEQTMCSQLAQVVSNTSYCKLLENINRTFDDLNLKGIKIRV